VHGWQLKEGHFEDAVRLLESRIAAGRPNTRVLATVGYTCGRAGDKQRARDILNHLISEKRVGRVPPVDLATVYLGLECWDDALQWLATACEERSATLYQFAVDPLFDPIRVTPEGERIRRSIGLPDLITCS
jgi:hypothetical protein